MKKSKFQIEREKAMRYFSKIIKPSFDYDKECDILYISFRGKRKIDSTIELTDDLRIDVDKHERILGLELENVKQHLKENRI